MENQRRLFKCNGEVAEWCIARNKHEAYSFMDEFWDEGEIMENMYVKPYLKENPGKTIEDFIENFFTEENPDMEFTHPYGSEDDKPLTKKVSEWIKGIDTVPDYLCHENW